ncbi:MAG: O-antigen ligase family protein [Pseudomonadota bacterium]
MTTQRQTNFALVALLFGFCIQWIELGPLPVSQIALLLSVVFFTLQAPSKLPVGTDTDLFKIYGLFTVALLAGLTRTEDFGAGVSAIARSVVYMTLAYFFYIWLRTIPVEKCVNTLANSVFYVVPAFFVIFWMSSIFAGVDIIKQVLHALSTGNPNWLQYQVFAVVLNNGVLDENGLSSAARHGIMVSLMTVAHLHLFLRRRKSLLGTALCIFVYSFVFFSLSRSAILALLLGYICVFSVKLVTRQLPITRLVFLGGSLFLVVVFSGVLQNSGLLSIFSEKFVSDIANNPRVHEFIQIVDRINTHAVLGWGTGSPLNLFGLNAQYPHNFILYGWHQAGIVGLLISTLFFGFVVATLCKGLSLSMRNARSAPRVSRACLLSAALMCIVVVRLMFAKAGLLAVPEWIALCLSVYCQRAATLEIIGRKAADQSHDVTSISRGGPQAAFGISLSTR